MVKYNTIRNIDIIVYKTICYKFNIYLKEVSLKIDTTL